MGRYTLIAGAMDITAKSGEVVIGELFDLKPTKNDTSSVAHFELMLQSGQYRHTEEHSTYDPMSPILFPVFDGFGQDRKVAGWLQTNLYWRFMMRKILPNNIEGVVCVLESSDGWNHTYEVNGVDAIYLGEGDLHDIEYDHLKHSTDLVTALRDSAGPETRSFTTAGVNGQFMNYTLRLYPSNKFKGIFVDTRGRRDSSIIGAAFIVAICLFMLHDCIVRKRQKIVLDRAVRATAVVSSLFPENVREHIINDEGDSPSEKQNRGNAFLRSTVNKVVSNGPPIAKLHTDCTVCFADLTGFTKWSSTREPDQVFQLLETIFKEFDLIAAKRGVFKVETIGDCYMAVVRNPYVGGHAFLGKRSGSLLI